MFVIFFFVSYYDLFFVFKNYLPWFILYLKALKIKKKHLNTQSRFFTCYINGKSLVLIGDFKIKLRILSGREIFSVFIGAF